MIYSRIYTAASHDSLKPLFSRQNFIQLSAFRKMESEKRRGGSLNSRGRRHPFSCYSPHSSQSNEQMFQDRMLGDGNQDGNLSYRVRCSPFVEDSSNPCESVSYEGQKDEPSIATSDANDNGHSHIGGRQHERKAGEGSQDRYSILRPRHTPAQDSHNSRKSVPYESSMHQKDEPSIATSDIKDNGPSHIGGRQHERKAGEGSQDRYSILRPRHTPSAQDSHNSHKSASYEGQKDKPSIATSDVNDNGRSHIGGREHERKVGEGSQDRYSISRPRHSPSAQDSPNSHKSGLFPKGSKSQRIGTSPASVGNADSRSHVGGLPHRQMLRHGQVAANANSRFERFECSFTVSFTVEGMIQDGAVNCNPPQQIDSTEKGMETGFDICPKKTTALVKLKSSLLLKNKEKRKEQKKQKEQEQMDKGHQIKQLRSGMILSKNYLGHSEQASDNNSMYQKDEPSISASNIKDNGHCHKGGRQHERMVGEESQDRYSSSRCSPSVEDSSNPCESASYEGPMYEKDESSIATSDVNDNGHSRIGGWQHERKGSMSVRIGTSPTSEENNFTEKGMETGFDVCPRKTTAPVKLNPSLFLKNIEKRKEREKQKEQEQMGKGHQIKQLRSGMILLKKYLGHSEQVEIIKECHRLGLGKGGFYQPGYSNGAKLHLQMMCLGKDWDPVNKYRNRRFVDDAEPPSIPDGFKTMVKRSLQDSHDFIKQDSKVSSVEDILPNLKPDICIVNFYTDKGKLGLHQDKDESPDSLHKRLPVVSFSIGDSAEFLYGDERFADKAEKVTLESGDVLIYGGESRHIFHGVSSILPGTAPNLLVEETNLRPGRLNLTFRQY